jgi:hypothetical protein
MKAPHAMRRMFDPFVRSTLDAWIRKSSLVSFRQGTVREDYGLDGDTWNCFSHDQSRSRAYFLRRRNSWNSTRPRRWPNWSWHRKGMPSLA